MANTVANAIDWWVDKLNKLHLVPTNAATMLRDISAKQLSDGNFTPRPLTEDSFSDAELDAIYRLAYAIDADKASAIREPSYFNVAQQEGQNFRYGATRLDLGKYFSPLRSLSTTLGQAGIKHDENGDRVVDTYDFNKVKLPYYNIGHGKFITTIRDAETQEPVVFHDRQRNDMEAFLASLAKYGGKKFKGNDSQVYTKFLDNPYGRMRENMARLGHVDSDPDSQKIKADISLGKIKERLGDRLGTMEVTKPMEKKDLVLRSIGAGALTGAPVGAALGALSGAILMLNKNRRKKWFRTMLSHIAMGAAISAAAGGALGGMASNMAWKHFEKKSDDRSRPDADPKKNRRSRIRSAIVNALAYTLPLSVASGIGYYAHKNLGKIKDLLNAPGKLTNSVELAPMSDEDAEDILLPLSSESKARIFADYNP